uniref:GST C-terminal domain-containing protein n=1 Tax=Steinernema glaseri TaxID=37863 RepID=A0A1I7ZGW0_9BILA
MLGYLIQDMSVAEGIKEWPYVLLGYKEANKEDYFREKVRPQLENFAPLVEKFLLENGNNLLVGDKVTWVDVFAAEYFSKFIDFGEKDCLEAFPRILELIARVHNIPAIKKHIEQRPATLC